MESHDQPLVTVISLCYNNGRFVVQGLESVRNQTYKNIQHLIADDCSQDDSVAVIEEWIRKHNYKCTFIKRAKNLGICKGLNELLKLAKGKYFSGVSDDVWLPEKTERQVQILENSPEEVGVVYSNTFQIDEYGNELPGMGIQDPKAILVPHEGFMFDRLWEENRIPALTALTRRECFTQVGTYDENLYFEDWDMWLRISRKFRFVYDNKPSAKYRIISTSMMQANKEAIQQSTDLFRVKYYYRKWLSAEQKEIAISAMDRAVWHKYQAGLHIPMRWKWTLLQTKCSTKMLCLLICSTCGFSFSSFLKILGTGVAVKRMLH